jgi:hypothetical protein
MVRLPPGKEKSQGILDEFPAERGSCLTSVFGR